MITLIIESFLSFEQITLTLSVQRRYLLTNSYDIALLYSVGCIHPIPTCQTPITLITLIIESFLSSEQITLTLSVQRRYLLTYSYDIVLLYFLGCIHTIPICQTLITLITLIIESFLSSDQITLTLSMQRRYLLTYSCDIILLYSLGCIHPIPIIWTDNVNPICATTIASNSYDIVLLYSLGCIHPISTCQTLITLIALVTESFLTICTVNVNAICATTISPNIQLWYYIAVFPRLYPNTSYMSNTDYTDYTDCSVV